jgi:predicted RND superfamily exporter protein
MQPKIPVIRRFAKKYPLFTVIASAIAVLVSVAIIVSTKFNTDVTRLIPTHAEKTALYFSLMEKMGGREKAYIVFSSDNIMDHIQEIEKIGNEIRSSRLVSNVSWKISDETKVFLRDVYAAKAPLLLSEEEMDAFVRKLSPEGMARELEKTRRRLALPGNQEGLAMVDPLNFFELFAPHLKFSDGSFDPDSGYFLTPDKRNLIMFLTPTGSPRDIAFAQKFVSDVETVLALYRAKGFSAELTGNHAITLHEASAMKREIISNTLSSVISVMIIFLIFFRSLKGLLYVMFPVVTAMVTTMGIVLFFSGSFSEVTGAFAGMLAGLSDDLGIVLYVRYLVTMDDTASPVERMDRTIEAVYRGITIGMLTTALTFLPMVFSSFRGIRELGILTGTGMLLCWLFLFTITSLTIKPSSGRFIEIKALPDIAVFSCRNAAWVIAVVLGVTLLLGVFSPRVRFMGDITELGTDDNRPRKVFEDLKKTYIREQGVFLTDSFRDRESALVRSVEIKATLAKDFENISAAGDILPPLVMQKRNLEALAAIDPENVARNFRRIAAEKEFDIAGFGLFMDGLVKMLGNKEMISLRDVEPVREMLDRLLINEDGQWRIIITGNLRSNAPRAALEGYVYTGPAFIRQELLSILKKDTFTIGIISLLLVNIILYLDFRKISYVFLCQAPVVVSIVMTLGIMGVTGISLNFMDAIVLVLLFGIGTDYTVHLLHRHMVDPDIGRTFLQIGKAVLVAGLTTVAGVGSIGFSSYKGLATMGQVAAIGTILCVILSFTLIPALLGPREKGTAS